VNLGPRRLVEEYLYRMSKKVPVLLGPRFKVRNHITKPGPYVPNWDRILEQSKRKSAHSYQMTIDSSRMPLKETAIDEKNMSAYLAFSTPNLM
jgi:hypothetical protein